LKVARGVAELRVCPPAMSDSFLENYQQVEDFAEGEAEEYEEEVIGLDTVLHWPLL
jgi:hypothetical protein